MADVKSNSHAEPSRLAMFSELVRSLMKLVATAGMTSDDGAKEIAAPPREEMAVQILITKGVLLGVWLKEAV